MDHAKNLKMRMQRKYVFFDMQNILPKKPFLNGIILLCPVEHYVQLENISDFGYWISDWLTSLIILKL